jgi:DNA-binding PadR family transcriptional regulator
MLADPLRDWYGLQICSAPGPPSGTIHPILARVEGLGWMGSSWEDDTGAHADGRRPRRDYRLTEGGAEHARIALARVATSVSTIGLMSRPPGGA